VCVFECVVIGLGLEIAMIMTDDTQVVAAKKTRLLDFAVWKHGDRSDIRRVKVSDQHDALWDTFQVSGMILEKRYYTSTTVPSKGKCFIVGLDSTEWVVKRLTTLECDTTYNDCPIYA